MKRLFSFLGIAFIAACGGKTTLGDAGGAGGDAGSAGSAGSGGNGGDGAQGGNGGSFGGSRFGGNGAQGGFGGNGAQGGFGGSGAQGGSAGMSSCNDGGEGTCEDCQRVEFDFGGCCEVQANMCVNEVECLDFIDCLNVCYDTDPDPESCANTCVDQFPRGFEIYLTLVDCAFGTDPSNPGACGFVCGAF